MTLVNNHIPSHIHSVLAFPYRKHCKRSVYVYVISICVSVQGYRQKDYFIATQAPLAHTVQDFWRMVWEWKCHSIVMLTELKEREQVCVHVFLYSYLYQCGSVMYNMHYSHFRRSVYVTGQQRAAYRLENMCWSWKEMYCVRLSASETCCCHMHQWV